MKIRLTDTNHKVKPETVKIGELTKLLSETEAMLLAQVGYNGLNKDDLSVSLTSIEDKSLGLILDSEPCVETAYLEIVNAVTLSDYSGIAKRSLKALHAYVKIAKKLNCSIELGRVDALITKDTVIPESKTIEEQGSVLYGKVITVGNRNLSVKLELLTGELLTIRVSEEAARKLGSKLLDIVMLHGNATLEVDTFDLVDFYITHVDDDYGQQKGINTNEWTEQVRSKVDFSRLDEIGAEAYLMEARGES